MQFANRVKKVQSSAIRDLLRYGADPSVISFGGGYPDPQLFPSGKLRAVYEILLTKHASRALQYTVSDGTPELRAQVAERMRDAMEAIGGDGFLISTPFQRTSRRFIVEVTEGLVPALHRRGLMRTACSGRTLREVLTEC